MNFSCFNFRRVAWSITGWYTAAAPVETPWVLQLITGSSKQDLDGAYTTWKNFTEILRTSSMSYILKLSNAAVAGGSLVKVACRGSSRVPNSFCLLDEVVNQVLRCRVAHWQNSGCIKSHMICEKIFHNFLGWLECVELFVIASRYFPSFGWYDDIPSPTEPTGVYRLEAWFDDTTVRVISIAAAVFWIHRPTTPRILSPHATSSIFREQNDLPTRAARNHTIQWTGALWWLILGSRHTVRFVSELHGNPVGWRTSIQEQLCVTYNIAWCWLILNFHVMIQVTPARLAITIP